MYWYSLSPLSLFLSLSFSLSFSLFLSLSLPLSLFLSLSLPPSPSRAGCKKTLSLIHYPCEIKFIHSFILSLSLSLSLFLSLCPRARECGITFDLFQKTNKKQRNLRCKFDVRPKPYQQDQNITPSHELTKSVVHYIRRGPSDVLSTQMQS